MGKASFNAFVYFIFVLKKLSWTQAYSKTPIMSPYPLFTDGIQVFRLREAEVNDSFREPFSKTVQR